MAVGFSILPRGFWNLRERERWRGPGRAEGNCKSSAVEEFVALVEKRLSAIRAFELAANIRELRLGR
jgi:hypothetical protein